MERSPTTGDPELVKGTGASTPEPEEVGEEVVPVEESSELGTEEPVESGTVEYPVLGGPRGFTSSKKLRSVAINTTCLKPTITHSWVRWVSKVAWPVRFPLGRDWFVGAIC